MLHNIELLNGEIFYTLREAQVLIEAWRRHYNAVRPHGSLSWRPPAPEAIVMPVWPIRRVENLEMEATMNQSCDWTPGWGAITTTSAPCPRSAIVEGIADTSPQATDTLLSPFVLKLNLSRSHPLDGCASRPAVHRQGASAVR